MKDSLFDSVDKLVEFGISTSMAQQMIQMMNQTMQTMYIPGQAIDKIEKEWYIAMEGKPMGPYTEHEVKDLFLKKAISEENLVWSADMSTWSAFSSIPELKKIIQIPPVI